MKKYLQIIIVLGGFFIAVLIRNILRGSEPAGVVGRSSASSPVQSSPQTQQKQYNNGSYTGNVVDAYYGNIQVAVTIADNKIADITFLEYPSDNSTSQLVNNQAMPILKSEAIESQKAAVDNVSGASQTSAAFSESLASALRQAE